MTVYYMDFAGGNDANSGVGSFANARRTPAGIGALGLVAGDEVHVAKTTSFWQPLAITATQNLDTATTIVVSAVDWALVAQTWIAGNSIGYNGATVATSTHTTLGPSSTYTTVTLPASPAVNTKLWSLNLVTPVNLSAYTKIAVYAYWSAVPQASVGAGDYRICLCSDTVGDVIVDDIPLYVQGRNGTIYHPVILDKGSALGTSINSIALYSKTTGTPVGGVGLRFSFFTAHPTNGNIQPGDLVWKNHENYGAVATVNGAMVASTGTVYVQSGAYWTDWGAGQSLKRLRTVPLGTGQLFAPLTLAECTLPTGTAGGDANYIKWRGGYNTANDTQDGATWLPGASMQSASQTNGLLIADTKLNMQLERFFIGGARVTQPSLAFFTFNGTAGTTPIRAKFVDCGIVDNVTNNNYQIFQQATQQSMDKVEFEGCVSGCGQSTWLSGGWLTSSVGTIDNLLSFTGGSMGNMPIRPATYMSFSVTNSGFWSTVAGGTDTGYDQGCTLTMTNLRLGNQTKYLFSGSAPPTTMTVSGLSLRAADLQYHRWSFTATASVAAGTRTCTISNITTENEYVGNSADELFNFAVECDRERFTATVSGVNPSVGRLVFGGDIEITGGTISNYGSISVRNPYGPRPYLTKVSGLTISGTFNTSLGYSHDFEDALVENCTFGCNSGTYTATGGLPQIVRYCGFTDFKNCTFDNTQGTYSVVCTSFYQASTREADTNHVRLINCTFKRWCFSPNYYNEGRVELIAPVFESMNYNAPIVWAGSGLGPPRDCIIRHSTFIGTMWSYWGTTGSPNTTRCSPYPGFRVFNSNSREWYFGHELGDIWTETSIVHTAGGRGWLYRPFSTTTARSLRKDQLKFPIGRVAVKSGYLAVVRLWVRIPNPQSLAVKKMYLVAEAGQLAAPDAELSTSTTLNNDTWEEISISWTPSANGVVSFYVTGEHSATTLGQYYYVDDLSFAHS